MFPLSTSRRMADRALMTGGGGAVGSQLVELDRLSDPVTGKARFGRDRHQQRQQQQPDPHLRTNEPCAGRSRKGRADQRRRSIRFRSRQPRRLPAGPRGRGCRRVVGPHPRRRPPWARRSISVATNHAIPIAIRMSPALAMPGNGGGRREPIVQPGEVRVGHRQGRRCLARLPTAASTPCPSTGIRPPLAARTISLQ